MTFFHLSQHFHGLWISSVLVLNSFLGRNIPLCLYIQFVYSFVSFWTLFHFSTWIMLLISTLMQICLNMCPNFLGYIFQGMELSHWHRYGKEKSTVEHKAQQQTHAYIIIWFVTKVTLQCSVVVDDAGSTIYLYGKKWLLTLNSSHLTKKSSWVI